MYKCSQCGKEYKTQAALSGHMSIHKVSNETYQCSLCGKDFTKRSSFLNHERYCKVKASKLIVPKHISTYNVDKEVFCKHCGKQCKNENSQKQHELRCKENPERINIIVKGFNDADKVAWNKDKRKDTDERVQRNADAVKKFYETHPGSFTGRTHTDEYKNYMSDVAKNRSLGGFNMRKASITYEGVKLDSTYEFEVAKSLDADNIRWQRCGRFEYQHNDGSIHYYTPDFYLPEYDVYLDPKNDYLIEHVNEFTGMTDVEKIHRAAKANNIRVIILDKESLTWDKIKELI